MARTGPYNLDRTTKLLESHKQFPGGLKTVDSDDALGSFFLRDAENISLSEYGFLERRYGLVDDANFELIITGLQQGNLQEGFKDRLQGYFEYTRPDGIVETVVFVNGRLYLNGVQVKQLYPYPQGTFANYGPSIDTAKFKDYVQATYEIDFTSFTNFDKLFDTGRSVEATIIGKKMYFFTGVYPIVYEGTGEFYLLPEYVPDFNDLFLAGHNLHISDFDRIYNTGKPLPAFLPDMSDQTDPVFSDLGYQPLLPYNINPSELQAGDPGRGLHIKADFRLPVDPIYDVVFSGFSPLVPGEDYTSASNEVQYSNGLYLELFPEVYTRPSGSPEDDRLWIQVGDENLDYNLVSNLSAQVGFLRGDFRFIPDRFKSVDPTLNKVASFVKLNRALEALTFEQYFNSTEPYKVVIKNLPVGYHDYRIVFKLRKAGWRKNTGDDEAFELTFFGENQFLVEKEYVITRVFASDNKTDDFRRIRPEALWTCNKVLNHYGKLMAYGSLTEPQRLFIGGPRLENREYFPFSFTRDFETDAAEPIQAIVPFMNILTILTKTFTFGLAGIDAFIGSENLYRQFTISPLYGTIAPNSVRPVRNQLFFLSKEGLVSLQSLYAIDEQYNVKKLDSNIENIVPLDPEAVAIQFDDHYWIHFPNTANNITLRYDLEKRAWMKDTYFEWNGLDENSLPVPSPTVFNGVHKYLRESDRLILVTNPMQSGGVGNYSIRKLHVDYTVATDLWETPRTLFETSFLNQGYPFHEKKFMEKKFEFTIQNEYHLGKEAVYLDRDMEMPNNTIVYTANEIPLVKNHEYRVNVPNANIQGYNIRLFDIQGNLVKTIAVREDTPPPPSVLDFLISGQNATFKVVSNDGTTDNDIEFQFNDREDSPFRQSLANVSSTSPRFAFITNLPFGLNKLVIRARRGETGSNSIPRTIYFQVPDGVYDETGPSLPPPPASLPVAGLSVVSKDNSGNNQADAFTVSWQDQNINPSSDFFEVSYENITTVNPDPEQRVVILDPVQGTTVEIPALGFFSGDDFIIRVRASLRGVFSSTVERTVRLFISTEVPTSVTFVTQQFPADSRRLTVLWGDVSGESEYQIYWKYSLDNISPFTYESAYTSQRDILNENTSSFQFRTERETSSAAASLPPILTNGVLDFGILPRNSVGPATIPKIHQVVVPANYDPAQFIINPIDGEKGIRIEIPQALKQMPIRTGGGPGDPNTTSSVVFEDRWEIQFRPVPPPGTNPSWSLNVAFDTSELAVKNVFELKPPQFNFDAQTAYQFRLRPRHIVNGALLAGGNFFALQTHDGQSNDSYGANFIATTGTDVPVATIAPTIESVSSTTSSISFVLRNQDNQLADLSYLVSTSNGDRVTEVNRNGVAPSVAPNAPTSTLTVSGLASSTTYYITAGGKTATKVFSTNADIDAKKATRTTLTPAPPPSQTVTATFNSNGGTPTYSSQSGPSPLSVSNPGSPTRSGFTFNGWSPAVPTTISADTTFVAQWLEDTSPNPPNAPTNLILTNNGGGSVTASWTHDGQNVQGFFANWGVGQTTNYNLGSINLGSAARSHTITGLTTNQAFYFRVSAGNVDGDSAFLSGSIFLAF
jgi:hypothetical protein